MKIPLCCIAFLTLSLAAVRGATVFTFESGFTAGQTSFTRGDLTVSLGGPLVLTEFPTFGSGEGDWFMDSGFGVPVAGNAGSISVTTTAIAGFELLGVDLWTSNDGGGTYTAGNITLTGLFAGGGSASAVVAVTPTGNSGLDWDTSIDLSAFAGKTLTSLEISLGAGINYVAIDNLSMGSVAAVPEPGAVLLSALSFGALCLRRRVGAAEALLPQRTGCGSPRPEHRQRRRSSRRARDLTASRIAAKRRFFRIFNSLSTSALRD